MKHRSPRFSTHGTHGISGSSRPNTDFKKTPAGVKKAIGPSITAGHLPPGARCADKASIGASTNTGTLSTDGLVDHKLNIDLHHTLPATTKLGCGC